METTTIRLSGRFKPADAALTAVSIPAPIFFKMPAKKKLTIESFSAECYLPSGQTATLRLFVIDPLDKSGIEPLKYEIPLTYRASLHIDSTNPSAELRDIWAMNNLVRAYVPPGMRLQLDGTRGYFRHGLGGVDMIITGIYEDVP